MKFVSSISGLPISAASAAYAPTNGADVSAVASAYAESAASGKLDSTASSQFITSTAGLATTEYVDSSVSSKLDTTAFSTVSSNFLTSETVTATAGDGVYITSINGLGLSGQGGGGGGVVTATGSASATSGFWPVTTSYLVSSINGSALLPYGYSSLSANSANWTATRTAVTANSASWNSVYNTVYSNSASWSGSTGGGSVTSPSGTIIVMNGTSIEGTNSAVLTANGGEGFEEKLYAQDTHLGPQMKILAVGSVPGTGATLMMPMEQTAYTDFQVILSGNGENGWASASGTIPMGTLTASVPLEDITGAISASANQWFNLVNGTLTAKKDGGILVTGIGELAWKSAVDNVTNTVSANSANWGQGGVDSATVSAIASAYGHSALSSIYAGPGISYGGADDPMIGINYDGAGPLGTDDNNVLICKTDGTTIGVNAAGELVSLVGGGVDSATVSAIASSYAESAASSKLDTSAQVVTATASAYDMDGYAWTTEINGLEISAARAYSASYANTAETAYSADFASSSDKATYDTDGRFLSSLTDSAMVSAIASGYVSGKADSSALSSYALSADVSSTIDTVSSNSASWTQVVTSLSGNANFYNQINSKNISATVSYKARLDENGNSISALYDTVSTQSANWGGSALALSAGPGISLTMVGNTLVISTAGV